MRHLATSIKLAASNRSITELNMNWKEFPPAPKYDVSDEGEIRRRGAKKSLKPHRINSGYLTVVILSQGEKTKFRLVHRIVALTFVPNPHGLPQVNHKDGNKLNNHASNLEWCTAKQNSEHSILLGLKVYNSPTRGKKLPPRGKAGGSNYFGVCKPSGRNCFLVRVQDAGKVVFQKCFHDELEAARYYDTKVQEHGLNRPLNFPVS